MKDLHGAEVPLPQYIQEHPNSRRTEGKTEAAGSGTGGAKVPLWEVPGPTTPFGRQKEENQLEAEGHREFGGKHNGVDERSGQHRHSE